MARYKQYNYDQLKLLPVSFSRPILPGTFEYAESVKQTYTAKMKQKIATSEGRQQYTRHLGIVEPVFAHLASSIGLKRFSLRS